MKYPKIEVARIETASAYGMKTPNDASKKCMADTVRRLAKQRPQIVVVNYKTAPGDTFARKSRAITSALEIVKRAKLNAKVVILENAAPYIVDFVIRRMGEN